MAAASRRRAAPGPRRRRLTRRRRLARTTGVATALLLAIVLVMSWARPDPRAPASRNASDATLSPASTPSAQASRPRGAPTPPAAPRRVKPPPAASAPPKIPTRGSGRFEAAPAETNASVAPDAFSYTVEVEDALPFPPRQVAKTIDRTLNDRRGWAPRTGMTFQRVAGGSGTRVLLATPSTVDRLCAPLQTNGQVSCRNGDLVVLNALRWARGSPSYGDDITGYRRYLINHEVGHRLGRTHQTCPSPGAPAPLMVQQTKGLQGCEKNPWP